MLEDGLVDRADQLALVVRAEALDSIDHQRVFPIARVSHVQANLRLRIGRFEVLKQDLDDGGRASRFHR